MKTKDKYFIGACITVLMLGFNIPFLSAVSAILLIIFFVKMCNS